MPRKREILPKTVTVAACLSDRESEWLKSQKYCGETTSQAIRRLLLERINTDNNQFEERPTLETIPF